MTFAGFVVWIAYCLASSWELWRGRTEHLTARWPLIGLLIIHSVIIIGGLTDVLAGRLAQAGGAPSFDGWFGIINIEGIAYFMGTAICMAGLAQQRRENRSVHAAHFDSMTGIINRGPFLERAARLLERCQRNDAPLAFVMFDLDRFKSINDTHGHLAGDKVIRTFVEAARRALRPNDILGRFGGEEFAVVLPGTNLEAAYVIAERIRHNFTAATIEIGDALVTATVSGGVAQATPAGAILDVIAAADGALYRAKNLGRNRVERVKRDGADDGQDNIIRVA